ncbi:histidine--tRNA ligase, chloroplastic/mitochondrial isoform X2 [Cryptomeria japonica]|nr:histidine--tRNA ligase, chloroplastic/mitochondrial isoform X2 [Cryptomeria japonica]
MGKIPLEEIEKELAKVGIPSDAVGGILQALSLSSFELEELLGSGGGGVSELKQLFSFANEYGYADWIEFDASVVRGLAYYTGTVFEGFDRDGKLRAVCGGGRYDWLLSTFSGEDIPACGFGFDDAVIVELLREKKLIPVLTQKIDDIVFPLDKELRQAAAMVASSLRSKGNVVDLILEDRRLKWAFKHAERVNAKRMFLVGDAEWKRGAVRVKNLATREESDILINDLE